MTTSTVEQKQNQHGVEQKIEIVLAGVSVAGTSFSKKLRRFSSFSLLLVDFMVQ